MAGRCSDPVTPRKQAAPLGFGAAARPTAVVATGVAAAADGAAGEGDGLPTAAVAQYGRRGCAVLSFPAWDCEYAEAIEIVGARALGKRPSLACRSSPSQPPHLAIFGPRLFCTLSRSHGATQLARRGCCGAVAPRESAE